MTITTRQPISSIAADSTPIYVNASIIKPGGCSWFVYLRQVLGLDLKVTPTIPAIGTALHKICAALDTGEDVMSTMAEALNNPAFDAKVRATVNALVMSRPALPRPMTTLDGKLFVEQQMSVPFLHYIGFKDDGTPFNYTVILCFTIDRLCVNNNILILQDYKTSNYYRREDALRKYDYEFQFEFYKWMLYEFGHMWLDLPFANLAREFKLVSQVVVAQVGSKPDWALGQPRGFTIRQASLVRELVEHFIDNVVIPVHTTSYIPQNGMLHNQCGICDFAKVCHAGSDDMAQQLLSSNFTTKSYGNNYASASN